MEHGWSTIFDYVCSRLKSGQNSFVLSSAGCEWLTALSQNNTGRLLLVCLAIDLKAEAMSPDQFNDVLNALPQDSIDICQAIARKLLVDAHSTSPRWICGSRLPSGILDTKERFIRVLELGDFIRFYVRPSLAKGMRPEQVEEVLRQFFDDDDGMTLGDISAWWTGGHGRVWVLPLSEFLQLRDRANPREPGSVYLDALGLPFPPGEGVGLGGSPHVVAVEYPDYGTLSAEKNCEPKQPTALDATWDSPSPMYVSHGKEDGWGRTHSCTGQKYLESRYGTARERVHGKFEGLTWHFRALNVGPASPQFGLQTEKVLSAAINRFYDLDYDGTLKYSAMERSKEVAAQDE